MTPAAGAAALALLVAAAPAPPPATPTPRPPAAAEARQLAARKSWDELYLRFCTAKAADYREPDRKAVAAALLEASRALPDDLALSVACAEKSAELAPTVEAWLAAGDANLRLAQGAAAAAAYEEAVLLAPTHVRALVARADLAMQDGEPGLAASLYSKVPAKAAEHKSVQEKLAKARAAERERARALEELTRADRKIVVAATTAAREDPNAIGNEAACAESMRALCGLVRKCMPQDPGAASCDQAVTSECGKLEGLTRVSRKQMDACAAGLAKASCERFLGGARALTELSPACAPVEAALDALRDRPGP